MICRTCGIDKQQDEFYLRPDTGKYRTDCIECCKKRAINCYRQHEELYKQRARIWDENNKERKKELTTEWLKNNPDKRKQIVRKHYLSHKKEKNESSLKWAKNNKDKIKIIQAREHIKNKKRYLEYAKQLQKTRYLTDPSFRVQHNMATAVNSSLRGKKNHKRWVDLLGYDVDKLKNHLAKQFVDGMNWDNYGKWHIDHKIPISAFNINSYDDYDFKRCWSLKNLQPLWASDNLHKHAKLEKPFQPCLL
ncbi:MAG: hypothetical protein WC332_02355 [Clostridia bacterium]|jgi:hypothetical protein